MRDGGEQHRTFINKKERQSSGIFQNFKGLTLNMPFFCYYPNAGSARRSLLSGIGRSGVESRHTDRIYLS